MKDNLIHGKKMKVFFKNLLGELSWIATQTRPDLSSDVCLMTSSVNYCTIKEFFRLSRHREKILD